MWAPRWGTAGLDLSDLDIGHEFIDKSVPQAYVDMKMEHVGWLIDGTDIMTDNNRQDGGIKRIQYSDKVGHAAVRGLTWTLPYGLNSEHTSLFMGRTTEGSLVLLWGSRHKLVPLGPVDPRAPPINDAAERRGASVMNTRKRFARMLGHWCQRGCSRPRWRR